MSDENKINLQTINNLLSEDFNEKYLNTLK